MYILLILALATGEQVAEQKWFSTEAQCEARAKVFMQSLIPNKYRAVCFFDARQTPRIPKDTDKENTQS